MRKDETPYRFSAGVIRTNSGFGIDKVFTGRAELVRWLAMALKDNERVRYSRVKIEKFDGEKWRRVDFRPLPLQCEIDGETMDVLAWDMFNWLEDDE